MLIDPLVSFDLIDRDEANECLVRWGHKMGANNRPLYRAPIDFGLREMGELQGVICCDTLIRETCGLNRHTGFELSRLCAAAPRISRALIRLFTEFAYPAIVRTWGTPWAISYQNAKMHRGDLYRFDGWLRLRETSGGSDPRASDETVSASQRVIWGWHPSSTERATKAAEMAKADDDRRERDRERKRKRKRRKAA
jgi:antitoxin VapB